MNKLEKLIGIFCMGLILREKSPIRSKRALYDGTLSFKMTLRMRLSNVSNLSLFLELKKCHIVEQ